MNGNLAKYAAIGLLVAVLAIAIMPRDPVVRVIDSQATSGSGGSPTVTATLLNEGPGIEVRYWVLTPDSDERLCQGTLEIGTRETRAVSFSCPELGDPLTPFTVLTGPAG